MLKTMTVSLAIALCLAGTAAVSAQYYSGTLGTSGGWYFEEWTHYYHDGSAAPMGGMTAGNADNGTLAWLQGRADGGNHTGRRGFDINSPDDVHVFCHSQHMINGLSGWYTGGGVMGLRIQCLSKGSTPYGRGQVLGKEMNTNYKAVKCSNGDIAWGFYGNEGPYLQRVGLLCDSWP